LKSYPELRRKQKRILLIAWIFTMVVAAVAAADDAIPDWLQFTEAGSRIENALFRPMRLPGGAVLARRPPSESGPLLDELVSKEPANAELYSLRALIQRAAFAKLSAQSPRLSGIMSAQAGAKGSIGSPKLVQLVS